MYHDALQHLRKGDIILYPSDTIWGLGCDARNEKAVEKIFSLRQRPDSKAFIILITKIEQLSEYVLEVPELAWNLVEFAEKPLTVIYPKGKNLPTNLVPNCCIANRKIKIPITIGTVFMPG